VKNHVFRWEAAGILFVFLVGALLHFVFEWSGELKIVGAIASVNESVWEHFKQGFWPMCLWAAIEYRYVRAYTGNFLLAKGIAVYLLPLITGLSFYAYTAFTGKEILLVDISIFAAAVVLAQYASCRVMKAREPRFKFGNLIGLVMIIILAAILIMLTFCPPHLPIFLDHNTGGYGIP
jgi:hypothetical protein